ncbi:ABC transporter ATP-binding protein [Clostridium saccharobutylicum]|uniref:Putative ABC transporter ATP-binding protein YxlF n=1 Tax=Clostridium saccharobutylicum TaxID=169679 RepID=A0A1S8N1J6_CLOSA|nr:ATP-binding cassette domain-containing protein [Clostridium saccharobutylicum]OOM10389.1 putative ABC transporter ATP-binding protein YxlF [Clostridium saccharobutylicum]
MENIITTNNLNKKYGNIYRVKDLNLKISTNSIYGFLGPNGAGKSTTLKMILGLVKPTDGNIDVFDKHVNDKNRLEILKNVGSLIESPSYYGHLTAKENLKIIQTLRNVPEKNINKVLDIVRLEKEQDKKVNQYSLGMKQRLGLAAALINFPKLLILDEPTNGLDPAGIQEMRELICSLPEKYDMTVVVSSHLLSEIDQMANTVGIINHGQLIFQDNLETLHQKSQHKLAIKTIDNVKACNLLKSQNISCQTDSEYILLPETSDSFIVKCTKLFYENEIILLRIEERQKSLEDIFLKLTGKDMSL